MGVGEGLERRVHGSSGSPEMKKGRVGDKAQPGLYIGQKEEDERERRPGDGFGRRRARIGNGGGFSTGGR